MITLLEASKLNSGDVVRSAVIEQFARESDFLRVMGFDDIAGNAYKYAREQTLPGIAFRGIGESFTESTGIINPMAESLVIGGGDLDVDRFIVQTQGAAVRATHEMMKVKALAHEITRVMIKGDSTTNPREFDGLQVRVTGSQRIANGATSGGDVLSIAKLDELIDAVDNPTHLFMSKAMRRVITAAARDTAVSGYVTYSKDEFGRRVAMYNDLPIIVPYSDNGGTEPLAFDEANPGGGSAVGTSIYCVSIGDGMLKGIQNGVMSVRDLGELNEKPVYRTRVEWYIGMVIEHSRAVARLWGIKAGAAVK